ncbi:MAG: DUF2970 domain-containing protein [Massilia sp.]
MSPSSPATPHTRSFPSTLLAIVWSFVGLRSRKDFDRDVEGMNPWYVVGAGLLGTAILIAVLITIVHHVVP